MLALPLWAACSVLIDPDALQVRCEIENGDHDDPCLPLGQQCVNNICQDCEADARELCNGRDDDCDGEIDEGHDVDNDGFTWCGGGEVAMADCVDSDGKVHPSSTYDGTQAAAAPEEECDGKDNDCDSKVDEDRSCATMKKCIDDSGCPEDKRCDVGSGVCFIPRAVGSGCTNDSDCKGGFCLQPESFGLPKRLMLMDGRCATACCSNADCDKDSSCLISSSGARVCLPKTIVGVGSKKSGDRCAREEECASGFCYRNTCQTPCLNSAGCPGQECVLTGAPSEARIFLCGEPPGSRAAGEYCGGLAVLSCRTGYCNDDSYCSRSCARNADCSSSAACEFDEVRPVLAGPTAFLSVCKQRANGADAEGVEQLCCTDADCADNQLCAPNAADRPPWHMSCRGK